MNTVDSIMALAMRAAEAELAWDIASSKHPDDKDAHGVDEAKAALSDALDKAIAPAKPALNLYRVYKLLGDLISQLLQRGVSTDKEHPDRIAINKAERMMKVIQKAMEKP